MTGPLCFLRVSVTVTWLWWFTVTQGPLSGTLLLRKVEILHFAYFIYCHHDFRFLYEFGSHLGTWAHKWKS